MTVAPLGGAGLGPFSSRISSTSARVSAEGRNSRGFQSSCSNRSLNRTAAALALVRADQGKGPLAHSLSVDDPSRPESVVGQFPGGAGRHLPKAVPLPVHPPLKVRAPRQKEAFQEVPAVNLQGAFPLPFVDGLLKPDRVAGEPFPIQSDFLIAAVEDQVLSQRPPQVVNGFSERTPSVLMVPIGPEESRDGVPAVKATGRGDGKIREDGRELGLGKNGREFFPVWPPEAQGSKNLELDHGRQTMPRMEC